MSAHKDAVITITQGTETAGLKIPSSLFHQLGIPETFGPEEMRAVIKTALANQARQFAQRQTNQSVNTALGTIIETN